MYLLSVLNGVRHAQRGRSPPGRVGEDLGEGGHGGVVVQGQAGGLGLAL